MPNIYGEAFRHSKQAKDWKPFKGKWKVTKLPREAGTTPEMTYAEFRKLHPEK